jgi:hypothetical protein
MSPTCRAIITALQLSLGLLAAVLLIYGALTVTGSADAQEGEDPEVQAMIQRLQSVPIFTNLATPRVYDIFNWGKQISKRADVFTTVGDSNTTNGDFMRPLGIEGAGCNLGPYSNLQATIDFYTQAFQDAERNPFTHDSVAADMGFSSATVLDSFWSDRDYCDGRETPLLCEYRVSRPSAAIIMLGQIDINYGGLTVEEYRANMERIIQHSIGDGVIPVLTTIVFLPDRDVYRLSLEYNMALLDLSDYYDVPLINLWAAVQALPNYGIGPDRSHLAARVGSFCSFDGAERELGGTMRNLLTLQALDELRRTVLTQP